MFKTNIKNNDHTQKIAKHKICKRNMHINIKQIRASDKNHKKIAANKNHCYVKTNKTYFKKSHTPLGQGPGQF